MDDSNNPAKNNRGLYLDPRTKILFLITITTFALGGAGGRRVEMLAPVLCMVPFLLLITAKRFKTALVGIILLFASSILLEFANKINMSGLLYYLVLGSFGILSRFLPCIMMGRYLMESTTVSEFNAAMKKLHISDKVIIPLSVMFRFFPTVMDEAESIGWAMKMRGISLGGKHASKIIEYRMVPFMTCCVNIGEELSAAALTRGLGGEVKRTNICKIGFRLQDYFSVALCLIPWILLIMDVVK
ncbi:energy-coupling factor transport system permease protein [Acetitomaculum ruminis DSM 5522]|uniref:Energy-coupling factor transport system permease protein n=1 Tax=Acetitomaculum ruminis DSM 5522 TaxID=1120918 RepID=A0A1I0XJN4_9FIRM|nr:energy-coupling factor transporter transmembrane component T [Acetitomaculum ruminis]SFB00153.1 energy-coupling factor transport system permease protein [Acetitomaculum ruminis DSM 5522]